MSNWFYKTPHEWRLLLQKGRIFELTIKIRLLVASVDKAMEMGINWWQRDSYLSSKEKEAELERENKMLKERLDRIEEKIKVE
ncbi:MAG: hypothetical protein ACXWM6_11385 [Thermodesulfobacteriota bacterium]